jgi:hypothetical protein
MPYEIPIDEEILTDVEERVPEVKPPLATLDGTPEPVGRMEVELERG